MKFKRKDTEEKKAKYGVCSNINFMFKLSWENVRSVMLLVLIGAIVFVVQSVTKLYTIPIIIENVKNMVEPLQLVKIISFFVFVLILSGGLLIYLDENNFYGKIELRSKLVTDVNKKLCITSYPNITSQDFIKLYNKAHKSVQSNNEAAEAIWLTIQNLLQYIIGFIIYLILLCSVDINIIIITIITSLVSYFANKHFGGWRYRHRKEESKYAHKVSYIDRKLSDYTLAKDIRIFSMKSWISELYNKSLGLYESFVIKSERQYFISNIISVVLLFLRNGVAYYYLIHRVVSQQLSTAEFILYFTAVGGFTEWITGILTNMFELYKQSLDLSTLREFLNYEEHFKFETGESIIPDLNKKYDIELKNVSFRYDKAKKDTLKDINLKIRAGEKLAIVGMNGAGKTTLVKLICGFYNPTKGEVLLNGENIDNYNRFDYYKHFSAVFQNNSVLAGTVANNIAQSISNIDMNKVKDCVSKANLSEKIDSLEKGYDSKLCKEVYEDAIDFSGGEVQRLMLARALYKDSPIIVLDEPTAALDPIAENEIYNKYNELTSNRTSIYISHRLASTRFCDRIILISDNKILEEGTHEELMDLGGKYKDMFDIQSCYYKEGVVNCVEGK